jgi:hypothetical protein
MFIYYGKKRRALNQQSAGVVQCPYCLQVSHVIAVVCLNYIHIYWIPFFGWKSPLYFCATCQKALLPKGATGSRYRTDLVVSVPAEAQAVYQTLSPEARVPWYYFSGLILSALAFAFVLLSRP